MIKKRFISMLALLCLTVSGAWAQEETLLTTIENTGDNAGFTSGSKTFDNKATVTFSGEVYNNGDEQGWFSYEEGTLTVTAAEGYTITRVQFYNDSGSAFDEKAPFEAILVYDDLLGCIAKVNGTSIDYWGVTKIEVYGYADTPEPATVAVTGVTLAPTSATLTLGETETVTLTATVLPADATDKSVTWSSSNEAVATVSNDGVVTAVAAGTATITVTTTDGAKTATCAVTVAAPAAATYTVTLKEGTDDANKWEIAPAEATTTGVAAGTEVKATYGGTKKVKSVKAVKKAPASTPLDNTTTAWTAGTYAVPAGGLTYSDAITVSGDVTLTLTDGETLTLNKGISLAEGATLTIQGNGTMNVNGTDGNTSSTVGGNHGTLILTSGTLTATGGNGGNIGMSTDDSHGGNGGDAINGSVIVSGGTLTAWGGNGGSVDYMCYNCSGGNGGDAISGTLTINGGSTSVNDGSNGSIGDQCDYCTAGKGGKAVAGTVTDNR